MKKMLSPGSLLLLCGLLTATAGYSQQLGGTGTDAKMSPNGGADGTSLGSIYSPNLYDGSTNVQVPIYSYEGPGGGSYGVSFSYNTKGIKADQLASNVGLGFVLNSGGSIQRVVKDIPDELAKDPVIQGDVVNHYGGYFDFSKMRGRLAVAAETPAQAAETDVYRDKESDDFMVSLGSLSFTFNIGKTGQIFTHPNRRVKVELLDQGVPVTTQVPWPPYLEFRLTDEQGIVYYFKKGDMDHHWLSSAYPSTNTQREIFDYYCISRWVISRITFPNGSEINYTYNYITQGGYAKNANYVATEVSGTSIDVGLPESNSIDFSTPATIQYPNGTTVSFMYDDQTQRCDLQGISPLQKIRIGSGGNCTVYKLEQAYFVAAFPGNTTTELAYGGNCYSINYTPSGEVPVGSDRMYRLKLKAIRLWNCAETESEPFYSFEYDPTQLGVRGSGQDWFGYYNGKYAQWGINPSRPFHLSSYSSIPTHTHQGYGTLDYGLDKSEDVNYMKAGILTKVKNAYGGEVQFNYGAHSGLTNPITVNNFLVLPTDATFLGTDANDGLRLESIVEREKMRPSDYVTTTFTYEQGQRFLTGGYFRSWDKMTGSTGTTANKEVWQSNYVSPHHLVNGSNHGYGKVTTTVRNQSNTLLSRRETVFTNLTDATTSTPRYTLLGGSANYFDFPFTDKQYLRDWEMGLPLSISEYDQNNRIVSKVVNQYDFTSALDLTSSQTKQVLNEKVALVPYNNAPAVASNWGGDGQTFFALRSFSDTYRPYTGAALLQRSTVYRYISDNSYTTDETNYTYDSRDNLVDIKNQASDGSILSTRTIYNYAVPSTVGSTITNMTQAGLEKIVGTERWKQTGLASNNSTDKLLDASISTYTFQSGQLNLKGQHLLAIRQPLTVCQYTGNCGGPGVPPPYQSIDAAFGGSDPANFRKTAAVVLADVKGNPLESTIPGTESYKAMIWDTLSGQKLAEAVGCHFNDMAYTSFETRSGGCNFIYTQAALGSTVPGGMSGKSAYDLWNSSTNTANVLSGTQSLGGQDYLLTFWVKGTSFLPKIGNVALPIPADPITVVGNWKQYQIRFTGGGAVSIAGTAPGTLIDEVRLHPVSAMMQSQTYEPLYGISSASDARGRITYFEYDAFGRQRLVRDQEGNILSKTEQKIQ